MEVTSPTTVTVTIGGESREVEFSSHDRRGPSVTSFSGVVTGRYETGKKNWPASLTLVTDPHTGENWVDASFGFDSRTGKHRRASIAFTK